MLSERMTKQFAEVLHQSARITQKGAEFYFNSRRFFVKYPQKLDAAERKFVNDRREDLLCLAQLTNLSRHWFENDAQARNWFWEEVAEREAIILEAANASDSDAERLAIVDTTKQWYWLKVKIENQPSQPSQRARSE